MKLSDVECLMDDTQEAIARQRVCQQHQYAEFRLCLSLLRMRV